ncbi:MAG: hypothetical protein FJ220_00775 [Kiritimatiellaceae bacterium]|nr:hypothetical protein [Kiritimatiellaceae bacterium]
MMNNMKWFGRKGAMIVSVFVVLFFTSAQAFASDFTVTTNTDNTLTITGYVGTKGQLIVPSTLNGRTVTQIDRFAFAQSTVITNATIGSAITNLGAYAFWDCRKLVSVAIADGITLLGTETFSGCISLTNVTIPASVTTLERSVFMGCTSLSRVAIPDTVLWMGDYVFQGCTKLSEATIGNNVNSLSDGVFDGCTNLTRVTIGNRVTTLGEGAFYGCSSLSSITIPSSVRIIVGLVFANCTSLRSVYFQGNAPSLYDGNFTQVFHDPAKVTVYYLYGTTGWSSTFHGAPTAVWNPTAASNLVLNSSFENGGAAPVSWVRSGSATGSTGSAQDGANSLRITTANSSATQTLAIQSNTTYNLSVWVNVSGLTAGSAVFDTSDKYDGAGQGQFVLAATTAGWVKYSGSFTATNSSVTLRMFTGSTFSGTVYFDQVVLEPATQLVSPWSTQDVGGVGKAGSVVYNNGTFTLSGAGRQIGGTADALRYVHQIASGDCDIQVNVLSQTNAVSGAKAGVMIRESLSGNARSAGVWVSPTNGIYFTYRTGTGLTATNVIATGKNAPYWVRLTRTGNTFKAYYGATGTNWTQIGSSTTISMATNTFIGLGVCSGNTNVLSTTKMINVTAKP